MMVQENKHSIYFYTSITPVNKAEIWHKRNSVLHKHRYTTACEMHKCIQHCAGGCLPLIT